MQFNNHNHKKLKAQFWCTCKVLLFQSYMCYWDEQKDKNTLHHGPKNATFSHCISVHQIYEWVCWDLVTETLQLCK